jgi:hypothetical protein
MGSAIASPWYTAILVFVVMLVFGLPPEGPPKGGSI